MDRLHKQMLLTALTQHNFAEVKVGGTSMWPIIRNGDTVILQTKPLTLRVGSIVGFFADDQLIVHRIIWRKKKNDREWMLYVHGDACPGSLVSIGSKDVVGRVTGVRRNNVKKGQWLDGLSGLCMVPVGFILQRLVLLRMRSKR
jgi:signal peptidase I